MSSRSYSALVLAYTLAACAGPSQDAHSSADDGMLPDGGDPLPWGDPAGEPGPGDGTFPAGSNDPWWAGQWCAGFAAGTRPPGYPPDGPDPDPHAAFYAGLEGLADDALLAALRSRIDDHRALSYDNARGVIAEQLDCHDGWIECVYTGMRLQTSCTLPDGTLMNTEHTWPKSNMVGSDTAEGSEGDLHHLFPAQTRANSLRSSLPFGHPLWDLRELYADPDAPGAPSGSRIGRDDANMRLFEARIEHKGDAARAIFYFAVRYDRAVPGYEEQALRCWHALDPPSDAERARNDAIATAALQGAHNRNPFIDHPELVDRVSDF